MLDHERARVDAVERLMKIIGAKWKPAILFCLVHRGRMRFSELRRAIPDITQRMLTMRLRELERDGLVRRVVHGTVPPHVDYEMTPLGMEVHPFFRDLCAWGESRNADMAGARAAFDDAGIRQQKSRAATR